MARSRMLLLIGVVALIAAACGGDDTGGTTTTAGAPTTTVTTVAETTTTVATPTTTTTDAPTTTAIALEPPYLTIGETDLGAVLTDNTGMTLYLFTPDAQGDSTCIAACAVTWPPFTGDVSAGPGVDASLLGSITRGDGSMQATYNGWPLYFYSGDTEPGHTRGQGIGGVWWALDAEGEPRD